MRTKTATPPPRPLARLISLIYGEIMWCWAFGLSAYLMGHARRVAIVYRHWQWFCKRRRANVGSS